MTHHLEKMHYTDTELAGHVHKLDVKLQSLCGSGFSFFALRVLAKSYHIAANWPTIFYENRDGIHFFTLVAIGNPERHVRRDSHRGSKQQ